MGLYTRITRDWLEQRFQKRSPSGVYLAHMPIYGYGTADAEGNQLGRLARMLRILRALDGLSFGSLLDVGGAEGFLPHLARTLFGVEAASSDLSHEACRRARELFGLPSCAVDSTALPFVDGAFDVVVCSEVLEHVENPVETMLELQRIARVAVILTTEELHHDRAAVDDYLFRRPGWPHMERNLFCPDDLAAAFPGAVLTPQTDVPPPQELLPFVEARRWLSANTTTDELAPGRIGVVVTALASPTARRTRRHPDERLLDALLAPAVAPGAAWPTEAPDHVLAQRWCSPRDRGPLQRNGDRLVGAGTAHQIRASVADFVDAAAPAPSREALAARLAAFPPARREALLHLRDRLFLPDRWPQARFDLRVREQRRGFWPNQDLVPRDGGEGFCWRSIGPDPWVVTPCLQRRIRAIEIEMRVHAPGVPVAEGTGQVFWKGPDDEAFEEARSVQWRVPNDGAVHVHRVVLEGHPLLPDEVQWLRIDPIDGACEVDLLSLRIE